MEREFDDLDLDLNHGLVLTRRPSESVIITARCPHCEHQERIKIKCLSIKGQQARSMYSASRDTVTIHRQEVEDRIKKEEQDIIDNAAQYYDV
jgi:sRNA-binding carbon storage regulator CsrA